MKKSNFLMLPVVLMMAVAGMMFTSCGDEGDEPGKKPETPETPENATWTTTYLVHATFGDDMLNISDITAHIANPDGTFREEKIEKKDNEWTLTGDEIPDKAGVYFSFTAKTGLPADEVYRVDVNSTISGRSYRNGEEFSSKSDISSARQPLKGSQLEAYFKKMHTIVVALGTNENGSVIDVEPSDVNFGVALPSNK